MPSQADRNQRLDDLQEAVDAWADKTTKRLNDEAALLEKILKGRPGAEKLNNGSVEAASDLLVDELDQFLTGE